MTSTRSTARAAALHVLRTLRAVRADVVRPPFVAPGHYYSPRTSENDAKRADASRRSPLGIDLGEADQIELMKSLDLSVPRENRWSLHSDNEMFHAADAAVFRGLLLHKRPRRIVEVGSGYSTALALDVAEEALPDLQITCIEPHAGRLRSRIRPSDSDRLTVIERPVQDIEPREVIAELGAGDFLFIDSTHVVKSGSDVLWLLLHTLPLLPAGVLVHVHDIHWPFEYPGGWLREQRDWTETYLLHAFLIGNSQWRIVVFVHWLIEEHPEVVPVGLRDVLAGSIWLERVEDPKP